MNPHGLTDEERAELRRLHRAQRKDAKAADRIKAILMWDSGYSQREIAAVLLRDENTVGQWISDYTNRNSLQEWLKDGYNGYLGKLNKEQLAQVEQYVKDNLIHSAERVVLYIQEQFGLTYTVSGVQEMLKRLEFVYKQTTHYPSKLDPEKQAAFKQWFETLEKGLDEKTLVLFLDGVHPHHNTKPMKVWIKKGEYKFVPANTGRKRLNINGAYNPHQVEVVIHESETINTETTIELFKKIEAHYPDKENIIAICDNARYYHNEKIQEYLRGSPINLVFLPPYSPNLNLIERLWKLMKKEVINLKYYPTFKEFKDSVLGFFENFDDNKQKAKRFVGTKLRLIQPLAA